MSKRTNPDELVASLTLIEFKKSKGTEVRSGYVLTFTTPIDNAAVPGDDEREVKKTLHGILTLERASMFADKKAAGRHKMTMTGKLRRTNVAAQKEAPAYAKWTFTLANRPQETDLHVLLDMAAADGDDSESTSLATFKIQKVTEDDDAPGPRLFSETPNELSDEDAAFLKGEAD